MRGTVKILQNSDGTYYKRTIYPRAAQEKLWQNDFTRMMIDTRSVLDNLEKMPTYDVNWNNVQGTARQTIGLPPPVDYFDTFIK